VRLINADILQKVLDSELVEGSTATVPDFSGLSIDSRTIKEGEIFFAIIGDKHDGHEYVADAFAKGAAAAVISGSSRGRFGDNFPGAMFVVEDTHEALLNLAGYLRRRSEARFAAISGSNGKTTTKEMLYAIVSAGHDAYRSPGNLNNLYGLPISLGRMPEQVDYAVFELGISVPGEMSRLASIIKPDLAVLTNIGPVHLETLYTVENVVKAKFELIDRLPVGAAIVLNADDPHLMAEARRRNLDFIGFGIDNDCPIRAGNLQTTAANGTTFTVQGATIALPVFGRINVYNALAAIAASSVWGCSADDWRAGLESFGGVAMRMTFEEVKGLHLLIDCYNANPDSTAAALQAIHDMTSAGRKIAVLGDMLELGETSARMHYNIGHAAAEAGLDYLLCLGPESKQTIAGAREHGLADDITRHFENHQALLDALVTIIAPGDLILFKGSRGMALEKIVNGLKGTAFTGN